MNRTDGKFFLWVALLLIFLMAARTALDTDMWWHLRSGMLSIQERAPLTIDRFSHTQSGRLWTNHSWLGQVLMFAAYSGGGYAGLALLVALVAVAGMGLTALQLRGNALVNAFLLIFGGAAASVVWAPRPQVFSLALLAFTGYLVSVLRNRNRHWVWLLPAVFVLWGNLHGGYPLGLILVGAWVAGEALEKLLYDQPTQSWNQIGALAAAGAAAYFATAINPNGLRTWLIPFQTVGVQGLQNLVSEWASPDFHQPIQLVFLLYFFALLTVLILSARRVTFPGLLGVLIFGAMAFMARRNIGPFVIVSLPVFSTALNAGLLRESRLLQWWAKTRPTGHLSRSLKPTLQRAINTLLIALLTLAGILKLAAANQQAFIDTYLSEHAPERAAAWVQENLPAGNLLNEYDWGGFLIWRLPNYPVYIDGRTDLFGDDLINEWLAVLQCADGWEAQLQGREVQIMLLQPERQVVQCALERGWQPVYQDAAAVVLVPPGAGQD